MSAPNLCHKVNAMACDEHGVVNFRSFVFSVGWLAVPLYTRLRRNAWTFTLEWRPHGILDEMDEPKPAYNTVSTIVRILEKKGFVAHKAYGKTHEYYPVVSKDDYARRYMDTVLNNFFGGSVSRLVSFFSEHKAISLEETDAILDMLKNRK